MGLYELESPLAKLGDWRDVDYTLIGDVNDLVRLPSGPTNSRICSAPLW